MSNLLLKIKTIFFKGNRIVNNQVRLYGCLSLLLVIAACQPVTNLEAKQTASPEVSQFRTITAKQYRLKMMAGWIGQMVGVSYGSTTEFRYIERTIPTAELPELYSGIVNQSFGQDDLYVEMTFLQTLDKYGLDVSAKQAGLDFARTEFPLWHANSAARMNLRSGIAAPDSGNPTFNFHSDDIDYQIESDFAGLISPGLPNSAIQLGETFGRIMNYGDGLYGGQFVSCMYSEAFFESNPEKLVQAGLACIPPESQYAQAIRDVLSGWKANPKDWQVTWAAIQAKYQENPDYRKASCSDAYFDKSFNIDAKINGAYVVLGLLYGQGDPVASMTIAMSAGQDSDCNPATAGGIISTVLGMNRLPEEFTSGLDVNKRWDYTEYNFTSLVKVSEALARKNVLRAGGRIEIDASGEEVFVIPIQKLEPRQLEQSWNPGPVTNSLFSSTELSSLTVGSSQLAQDVKTFAPGWRLVSCKEDETMGLKESLLGRSNVLLTKSGDWMPCVLAVRVDFSKETKTTLHLETAAQKGHPWILVVRVNGEEIYRKENFSTSGKAGWIETNLNLEKFLGKKVLLEVINLPFESGEGNGLISLLTLQ